MIRNIAAFIFFLILASPAFAAGSFSAGILLGADADGGSLREIADDLNYEMRVYEEANPGTVVDEIPAYYAPSLMINFRYLYDRLMFQLGWEYSASLFYNEKGSVDTAADGKNKIEIEYSRFTFPFSAGIVIPSGKRTRFYMAGGFNMSFMMLEIRQSDPSDPVLFSSLPEKKNSYSAYIPGYQFKLGAEVLLSRNYSMVFEYTRYMSNNISVDSDDEESKIDLGLNTHEIAFGINYTVDTGL